MKAEAARTLRDVLESDRRPRILVVGDVMLDRYVTGSVERISPEAPVPVLKPDAICEQLGGAGAVAEMLACWQADVTLVAIVGNDDAGETIRGRVRACGVRDELLASDDRTTTTKTRFMGLAGGRHAQQLLRLDEEDSRAPEQATLTRILEAITLGENFDAALISDYGKGLLTKQFTKALIRTLESGGVPVLVDPARGRDASDYRYATLLKPNRTEAEAITGIAIHAVTDAMNAGRRMTGWVPNVVVTLDKDGMAWSSFRGESKHFPSRAREVYDITGAGDMSLAAMGYGMACGLGVAEAIELANLAAGLEVERWGAVPVSKRELLATLAPPKRKKLLSRDELPVILAEQRASGRKVVFTNGCFDLLHPGHLATLEFAKSQGDCLVVGLNSDASVRALKGEGRPIVDWIGRAQMLAALACVDYVVLFGEHSVLPLITQVRPDILVKGGTTGAIVGREFVKEYGGSVLSAPEVPGYSTTRLAELAA